MLKSFSTQMSLVIQNALCDLDPVFSYFDSGLFEHDLYTYSLHKQYILLVPHIKETTLNLECW